MTTATLTPLQTIDSVYAAFTRGDIPHILGLVAPDASWRQSKYVPWGGDYTGTSGAAEFFTRLNEHSQTTGFVVNESFELGNQVFSFGRHECVMRATGKLAVVPFMFRWRVENGQIVSYDSYVDSGAAFTAAQP